MIFNERIKMLRQETGRSQEQTARALGIALRNYQRLEADGNTPNFKTLVQIADLYDVSMDYLAGRTEDRNGPVLFFSECGGYSYLDCLHWDERLRIEIIRGFVVQKLTPPTNHQVVYGNLICAIGNQINKNSSCEIIGRLGVRPFEKPGANPEDVDTFLVPDCLAVLDRSRFDKYGCIGAPDLVIEILSPATRELDLGTKREIYEEAGVKEYWAADPDTKTVVVYTLKDGAYQSVTYTDQDTITMGVFENCRVDLGRVFEGLIER